jgi:hypothetical protein
LQHLDFGDDGRKHRAAIYAFNVEEDAQPKSMELGLYPLGPVTLAPWIRNKPSATRASIPRLKA